MDRFQKIDKELASQGKNSHQNNVDLTLRLGLPNHVYSQDNTEISQSLNLNLFTTPQQVNLNHCNGSHMNTARGQPSMQCSKYGCSNNMVSGGHSTAGNNYNTIINSTTTGGPVNYFGRFNQTGINYMRGQITNTGAGPQIYSHHQYPNNIALMNNNNNPYTSTSAFSPQPIQQNSYNILHNTTSRGQSSGIKNSISLRTQHGRIDEQAQAQTIVLDADDQEEEEDDDEVIIIEDITDVVRDHIGEDAIDKRCSNPGCGTQATPMWRRGPLGPKTLCNACGLKYRKQEEKRAAATATAKAGNSTHH